MFSNRSWGNFLSKFLYICFFLFILKKRVKELDPHALFSIFEKGDEEIYEEHGVTEVLDNPFVLMGMVLRGLENYRLMEVLYMRNYPEEYEKARPAIRLKYYTTLYTYLKRIDWTKYENIYRIGQSFDINTTYKALEDLRKFFEKVEHYEKCAVIKEFIDHLKVEKLVYL